MRWKLKNSTSTKTILIMIVIVTIITIIISSLLSRAFAKHAFSEVDRFNQMNLIHVKESTEFIVYRLWEHAFRIYSDQQVQQYLSLAEAEAASHLKVRPILPNYLSNEPFIYSIYLINPEAKVIYDSKHGPFDYNNFHDKNILDLIANEEHLNLNFNFFTYKTESRTFLSLIVTHPDWKGHLVMNLDKQILEKHLFNEAILADIKFAIVDSSGQVMLGNENNSLPYEEIIYEKNNHSLSFESVYDNELWSVNFLGLDLQSWTIFQSTKISSWKQNVDDFHLKVAMSSTIFLLILFLFIIWISRKAYLPFEKIASQIKQRLPDTIALEAYPSKSDHEIIQSGFNSLLHIVEKMNQSIQEQKYLLKEEYFKQWIMQGDIKYAHKEYLQEESTIFYSTHIRLAVIRIIEYKSFTDKYDYNSRKLIKFAFTNICSEIFRSKLVNIETIDIGSDHIVIFIDSGQWQQQTIIDCLDECALQIDKWLHLKMAVALSQSYPISTNLRTVYDLMYELSMLQFITGENKVFIEQDIAQYSIFLDTTMHKFIDEKIIQAIKSKDKQQLEETIDSMFKEMQSINYSECRFQLTVIVYSLLKTFNRYMAFNSFKGIQKQLDHFNTLYEVKEWLNQVCLQIIMNISQLEGVSKREEVANEINEYVKLHFHDQALCADSIANHFSFSTSYVREIFKSVFSQSLSDYILLCRIENVKKLLLTTDYSVLDVAEKSGFTTKSHFYTTFKKVVGMTPAEFRQLNTKE